MNNVRFTLTSDDLGNAYRLNHVSSLKTKTAFLGFVNHSLIMMGCAALASIGFNIWTIPKAMVVALGFWTLIYALIIFTSYVRLSSFAERIYDQQKMLQDETLMEWSDSDLLVSTIRGSTRYPWSFFRSILGNQDILLLKQSDVTMSIIPKRALTAEQVESIMACFQTARTGDQEIFS